MAYSFWTGVWKSIKNTVIVLLPAMGAGWLAFVAALPAEWQGVAGFVGGFLAYLAKNYFQNKDLA